MTYNVFSGTLNLAQSISQSINLLFISSLCCQKCGTARSLITLQGTRSFCRELYDVCSMCFFILYLFRVNIVYQLLLLLFLLLTTVLVCICTSLAFTCN